MGPRGLPPDAAQPRLVSGAPQPGLYRSPGPACSRQSAGAAPGPKNPPPPARTQTVQAGGPVGQALTAGADRGWPGTPLTAPGSCLPRCAWGRGRRAAGAQHGTGCCASAGQRPPPGGRRPRGSRWRLIAIPPIVVIICFFISYPYTPVRAVKCHSLGWPAPGAVVSCRNKTITQGSAIVLQKKRDTMAKRCATAPPRAARGPCCVGPPDVPAHAGSAPEQIGGVRSASRGASGAAQRRAPTGAASAVAAGGGSRWPWWPCWPPRR